MSVDLDDYKEKLKEIADLLDKFKRLINVVLFKSQDTRTSKDLSKEQSRITQQP